MRERDIYIYFISQSFNTLKYFL